MYVEPLPSRGESPRTFTHAPARLERSRGRASVRFERDGTGRTMLADLHQSAPCRALLPASEDLPTAVFAATCGGLTSGDEVVFDLTVGEGAAAAATTQAAERLYRARPGDPPARVESRVMVGPGAYAEWLPQETILFDGARLERRTSFELAEDARVLACDLRVLGRAAHGEVFRQGFLADRIELRRSDRLTWVDALRLADAIPRQLSATVGFGDHAAIATVFYAAEDAAAQLETARALLETGSHVRAAASAWDGMLVARILARDSLALRKAVARFVIGLRVALGRPPLMPRFWAL
jgi:urease accessory protein